MHTTLNPQMIDLMERMLDLLVVANGLSKDNWRFAQGERTMRMIDGPDAKIVSKKHELRISWRPEGCDEDCTLTFWPPHVIMNLVTPAGKHYKLVLNDYSESVNIWSFGPNGGELVSEDDIEFVKLYDAMPKPGQLV